MNLIKDDYIVDIIVPVYNAYEDLIECINSINIAKTNFNYRIIIINDNSTDNRIENFLQNLKINNYIILNNEVNLGFVKSVNKGMKYSSNDVILLNSDTIVTDYWIDKLVEKGYSNPYIATVTPYTNNGTICSIPKFLNDNNIPDGYTANEYANLIERISIRKFIEIPTAVGFCMFIKREVLEKVGYFNEDDFGKGYGEENEFCMRAKYKGYIHTICDYCFIQHKGSMSFKEDKLKYIKKNLNKLNELYPEYDLTIKEFIENTDLKNIAEYISFHSDLKVNKKYNILYLIHNDVYDDIKHPIGGTEYHVKDIIENSDKTKYNFFILFAEKNIIYLRIINDKINKIFKFFISEQLKINTFYNFEFFDILKNIITHFDINLLHIQHLRDLPITTISSIKGFFKYLPIIVTVHDYFPIDPTVNLLDIKNEFCNAKIDKKKCSKCLEQRLGLRFEILDSWRNTFKSELSLANLIITPSYSAKNYLINILGIPDENIVVIEHGINLNSDLILERNSINLIKNKLNIAFIGGLAPYKGSGIVFQILDYFKNNNNIQFYVFGNLGDKKLEYFNSKNLYKFGRYKREEIIRLLKNFNIDLVIIPSICPETYSYTLSEAWAAKIPTICFNIGATGERAKCNKIGWVIDRPFNSNSIINIIESVIENKEILDEEKIKFNRCSFVKDVKVMVKEYDELYMNYINDSYTPNEKIDVIVQSNKYFYDKFFANIYLNNTDSNLIDIYKKEIDLMKNTFGWKLLEYIRKRHPRLGGFLKNMIKIYIKHS
ncbi:hypothetical protein BVF91_07510 [Thermoanaerobacterium sp. PSU-2]|uniref:glycosyltransferase n=1 Tax=Thermoanaerobacterium sp. PSU-2 TaxID=1930849 RepID=UPI000A230CB7|nr:glycosyltransferase [Thermoanaerobacterium sp. PSU-2]ORX23123.1 hypothetical protein BVF91_07510 [Thermoanaerobacterium sp. PSU-2]